MKQTLDLLITNLIRHHLRLLFNPQRCVESLLISSFISDWFKNIDSSSSSLEAITIILEASLFPLYLNVVDIVNSPIHETRWQILPNLAVHASHDFEHFLERLFGFNKVWPWSTDFFAMSKASNVKFFEYL